MSVTRSGTIALLSLSLVFAWACAWETVAGPMAPEAGQERVERTPAQPLPRIELERRNFRVLLLGNPNYFGTLLDSPLKPVKVMKHNTTYEEVTCVGFNPELDLLEATIQIKRPSGYKGSLCESGSMEYVRFFVDYGTGWVDAGLAAFNAHDIANTRDCEGQPDKPLVYVVTQPLVPQRKSCMQPVLPNVRAILSWDVAPEEHNPDWPPVWGNVLDQHIQIKPGPLRYVDLHEMLALDVLKKLPPMIEEIKELPIPIPDPPPLSLVDLTELYGVEKKGQIAAVEPHRFGLAHIQPLLMSGNQVALSNAVAEWEAAGLDLAGAIAALDQTKANVSYEELHCLGLEYNLDRLVATFKIKRPSGYSGWLCGPGSQEYVAFWADWDDTCQWTYLNTVKVNVHDIASIPSDGLAYSAILPVDLSSVRRPCGQPKIARIRAVLSWNSSPSTTDPDKLNYWGNRLDAHVQIRPGDPAPGPSDTPTIHQIGGIAVEYIHVTSNGMTKPEARFAASGVHADNAIPRRECPFGGFILVKGAPVLGHEYRLWARKSGASSPGEIVKSAFWVQPQVGPGFWKYPNSSTGYVDYMPWNVNTESVLARWIPSGDELWEIRLEMPTASGSTYTLWHRIQLDNTAPRRRPPDPPYEPPTVNCEIHIDGSGDCKDFTKGTPITGRFVARDEHFGRFALATLPSSMSPNSPTTALAHTSQTATFAAGGTAWELDTTGMQPCGYVVRLVVWDRAIIGSTHGHHNRSDFEVGFCLRE